MDLPDVRRARLGHLIATRYHGRQVDFLKESGESQSEISGMLNGRKSFGEKKARKIELAVGLPKGWLDESGDGVVTTETTAVADPLAAYINRVRAVLSGRPTSEIDRIVRGIELLVVPVAEATRPQHREKFSFTDSERTGEQNENAASQRRTSSK
ncbi:hypothetical protein [Burkholderia sp. Bp9031]|uniref:hypothetical protein n=1 Tax=Burkholderia sp. Bp9031 TaxID=2184566 RepID=UPI000F5FC5F4|nr:hypothetical protein [Burkholderia sp. Bp9031]